MNSDEDLRQRCNRAIDLMITSDSPLHENVNKVLEVFNNLSLDDTQEKNNRTIMRHFAKINNVFKKYDNITTYEDYRKISVDDLFSILLIIRKMIDKLDLSDK